MRIIQRLTNQIIIK